MGSVRLRPSVEPFAAPTGDVYLLGGDGGGDVVLRDAGPLAHALVGALAGRGTSDPARELSARGLGSESAVAAAVEELEAAGVVAGDRSDPAAGLSQAAAARYDRQLHYFDDQASPGRGAAAMQAALGDATIAVLGAGGLGSWAMAALAGAGVGRLVAVDDDTVELSNLNRQILYRTCDVGRPKVDVAGEALCALNPELDYAGLSRRVDGPASVFAVAEEADFVVCTADAPPHLIGRWVNEACLELGVPHVSAGQFPPRVRVGPTFVPGRTGCLACQERQFRREFALYDELVAQRQRRNPVAATLAPASGLIGSLLAMEVVHWVTGICPPATLGRSLVFDLQSFSAHWEVVHPDPECELCRATNGARRCS
jgi:molybdopterin-synthase adenylyltransferase